MAPNNLESDPQVKELTAQTSSIALRAQSLKIVSAQGYETASNDLKIVKGAIKQLETIRDGMTRPINASLKAIRDFFRGPEAKLTTAENQIKRAMIAYSDEQQRLQRLQQAKLEEQARKERERLAARAAKAEESGRVEQAHVLQQAAEAVVAPVIQREVPKVGGIVTREVWDFEIVDEMAVPREYLAVDESKIRKVVNALKGATGIPGVKVTPRNTIAAGAA